MSDNCDICGEPLEALSVGTGDGRAHRHCYEREHPPTPAQTLAQVARGRGDPVLGARVIAEMVPAELAEQIVDEFNRRLMLQWQRMCQP